MALLEMGLAETISNASTRQTVALHGVGPENDFSSCPVFTM